MKRGERSVEKTRKKKDNVVDKTIVLFLGWTEQATKLASKHGSSKNENETKKKGGDKYRRICLSRKFLAKKKAKVPYQHWKYKTDG